MIFILLQHLTYT